MAKRSKKSLNNSKKGGFKRKSKSKAGRRAIKKRIKAKTKRELILGIIAISPSGFGFVAPEDGGDDIFIPPQHLHSAMDGDSVSIEILPERRIDRNDPTKGKAGKIIEVVERARYTLVGKLLANHKVRPLSKRIAADIKIKGSLCGAKRGDWVEVIINPPQDKFEGFTGSIKKKIGKAGTIQSDLDAIVAEYSLEPPYDDEMEAFANSLEPREIERVDLTNLFCVTIDPADAKDYDDAVSLKQTDDADVVEIGVHIADVATWIAPNSRIDKEARKRGFTSYLPGRTLPMLPRQLTAKISLRPDGESFAHTVILTVNKKTGKILSSKRFHSRVQITRRLTFPMVQNFIDNGEYPAEWSNEFRNNLTELVKITQTMRKQRKKQEQFLQIDSSEVRLLCDEGADKIIGMQLKEQKEADKLIEECMLAANSAVATELIDKHISGLYRNHPEPMPEKLEEFAALMAKTFNLSVGDLSNRVNCNNFLSSLADNERKPVIINAFVRSMPRALYENEPALHFGLGKGRYSHFTSPIRRYSDLIVHQQLWAAEVNTRLKSKITMEKLAADISAKEENNDNAYFAAVDRLKLRYLEEQSEDDEVPKVHEGLIIKITGNGMLVDVHSLGIYGFIPHELLPRDFRFNASEGELFSYQRQQAFRAGDFIFLHLRGVDYAKGSAIFKPIL
ncbi:ribonuclease R family protein [Lentisphaerota bacterium WC36G]|nr:ribonuclease R [Lentisphaerae bacterium WC36]